MNDRARTLLREALTLARDERADVAAELLASLDEEPTEDPAVVEAVWAKEIERRARRVLSGESSGDRLARESAKLDRKEEAALAEEGMDSDLLAFRDREREPSQPLEDFIRELKRRRKL